MSKMRNVLLVALVVVTVAVGITEANFRQDNRCPQKDLKAMQPLLVQWLNSLQTHTSSSQQAVMVILKMCDADEDDELDGAEFSNCMMDQLRDQRIHTDCFNTFVTFVDRNRDGVIDEGELAGLLKI